MAFEISLAFLVPFSRKKILLNPVTTYAWPGMFIAISTSTVIQTLLQLLGNNTEWNCNLVNYSPDEHFELWKRYEKVTKVCKKIIYFYEANLSRRNLVRCNHEPMNLWVMTGDAEQEA